MSEKSPLAGLGKNNQPASAASIPEDANKSLPETVGKDTVKVTPKSPDEANPVIPPAGVVQEDNRSSNDHGQADPDATAISEYDESKRQARGMTDFDQLAPGIGDTSTEDGETCYTSHPIQRYRLGKYRFEKGVLKLKGKEVAKFEELLDELPETERHRIKKLDVAGAERIARANMAKMGGATKQIDSTVGDRGEKAKTGKEDLASAKDGGAVE